MLLAALSQASVMNVASLQYRHPVSTLHTDRAKHFLIDEAEEFTRLYPEETKKRLGLLFARHHESSKPCLQRANALVSPLPLRSLRKRERDGGV